MINQFVFSTLVHLMFSFLIFVRGGGTKKTYVRIKHLDDIPLPGTKANLGTGDALANVPVSPPKGRRTTIEGIAKHGALLYGEAAEDGQAAAKGAAVVELAVGQHLARVAPYGSVVRLGPALLEADDVRRGGQPRELAANLIEARLAEVGDVKEAPAVEGQEVQFGGWEKVSGALALAVVGVVIVSM